MKIITPGKMFLFYCKCCGCEFVEGAMQLKSTKYDPAPTEICPCCGNEVVGIHDDIVFERIMKKENDHL